MATTSKTLAGRWKATIKQIGRYLISMTFIRKSDRTNRTRRIDKNENSMRAVSSRRHPCASLSCIGIDANR